ncbi:MAG TPA: SEC-C metal-binding domain-containing protein [Pyrinomonadaceae bacterium]|jgi:hypothetical protein|nr:SEC-C metal-binding domain-containing protein [Pyrinomonadaceae bacterium]
MATYPNSELFKQIEETLRDEAREATEQLKDLAQAVNAERLFVSVVAALVIAPADQITEASHGTVSAKSELLAFHLFPFFGFSANQEVTAHQVATCTAALEQLFRASNLLDTYSSRPPSPAESLARQVQTEARIVRGSAYQEQTADEIKSVQAQFDSWFAAKVGISATRAQDFLWAIQAAQGAAVNDFMIDVVSFAETMKEDWIKAKKTPSKRRTANDHGKLSTLKDEKAAWDVGYSSCLNEHAFEKLPVELNRLNALPVPTEREWQSLINLIGLPKDVRNGLTDPIEIKSRPLYVLPDDRVLLVDIANALDAVWDALDQIAKKDNKFFDGKYQPRKAKWLEEKVVEYLGKIFPNTNIYHDLSYPDLDKPGKATTELDVAVLWGPFLILVEAKAKQFRLESQLGDIGRLRTDIKKNVEDAFEQARRAATYIDKTDKPEFTEIATGRKVRVDKGKIRRTYLLTVSLHQLAGLATRLAVFQDVGLFKDGEYPLSISLADLETVSEFCEGPDVLLHYIERRLEVQKSDQEMLVDELDFFGAYLDTRFRLERFFPQGEEEKTKYNAILLSGWSEQFDSWMMYRRGDISHAPEIRLNVPNEIRDILVELRTRNDDDGARWIAFTLLGMSDASLGVISRAFREIRSATLTPGMLRRLVNQVEDTVISVVASLDQSPDRLRVRTEMIATLEKYKRKASKSIGFGIMVHDQTRPFESATLVEYPWKHQVELEQLLKDEPPMAPAPGTKRPGRNEPCICGSGKKFKKCCLNKVEDMKSIRSKLR